MSLPDGPHSLIIVLVRDIFFIGCVKTSSDYGLFTHRNPGRYKLRNDGGSQYRSDDRRFFALLFQAPPRMTLNPPVGSPSGFCGGLLV